MKRTGLRRREFLAGGGASGVLACLAAGNTLGLAAGDAGRPVSREWRAIETAIAAMEGDSPAYLAVARPDGRFLNLLARMIQARRALELGTAHGYAAIWLAAALEETGGRLTTVEILTERATAARQHIAAAGLASRVNVIEGDAHQVVPTLDGPFDLVYLNADKAGLVDYFQKLVPAKLAPRAVLAAFGVLKAAEKMKAYLDLVESHPGFDTVKLSSTMDDGFVVSFRRQSRA